MTRVKICGLKTLEDVDKVNRYLPDYIGFVFARTKRFVTDEQALAMKRALDDRIQAVGVFVDEPLEHVADLCAKGIIDMVQLHGAESESYIRELKRKTDARVIKAIRVQTPEQVAALMSDEADYMLFDTYKKGELGGTGVRLQPEILEQSLADIDKPFFLAGGLDPENVREASGRFNCFAVDVSTGVETDGVKDEEKIRRFIANVRGA
ncbi:MAG: phosphoribosylanthranilate isomerase [Lachnospiraceae bacterium]|nr:phosphoribosylanthranilate isomerase [Lachnospiraceae bacterium]